MSDDQKDVVIAAYLFEDLAKKDFDAVLKLAEDKATRQVTTWVARASRSAEASGLSSASSHRRCWPQPRSERRLAG